ncbi:unnamed protein product [Somion occarium]|uniref:RBR-type E3 ubiquitin transferase n=1 Tax=Somion occarium TaxID=3059160 RepID=A0ABP1CLH4_9APHY
MSSISSQRATAGSEDDLADMLLLVASMTPEDVEDFQGHRNGKAADAMTDEELAVQIYAEEANNLLILAQDSVFTRSLNTALRSDRSLIRQMVQEETSAIRDRRMALAMSSGRIDVPVSTRHSVADDPASLMSAETSSDSDEEQVTSAVASSSRVTLVPIAPRELHDCVICTDTIRGMEIRAPCGHFYDVRCLVDLFRSTVRDESLFPPRCCQQPFIFDQIRRYLGHDLAAQFQQKSIEFSTADRVYCHRPTCSTFLGAATNHASPLRCRRCSNSTCAHCKESAHLDLPCSSELDAAVLALAEQEGWKRCPGCHRLVELTMGCYHMTCRCRKQFCYVCTETWKNCTCPQWEENRLLVVARDRVNREIREEPAARPAGDVFRTRVVEMAARLREDHDCRHTGWSYRTGGGQCEICNYRLPQYLLRCRGCQTLACVRCTRNRL